MSKIKRVDINKIEKLKEKHLETFKEISYDNENNHYLVNSTVYAHNFDKLHFDYCQRNKCNQTKTPDAIYCTSVAYNFIEFRNKHGLDPDFYDDIKLKMIEGIDNLSDILLESQVIKRSSDIHNFPLKFILVYSKKKYDEQKSKISSRSNQKARMRFRYKDHQVLLEEITKFKGYPFSDVLLISDKKFDEDFVPKLISKS